MFERFLDIWYWVNMIPLSQKSNIIDNLLTIQMVIIFVWLTGNLYLIFKEGNDFVLMTIITGWGQGVQESTRL